MKPRRLLVQQHKTGSAMDNLKLNESFDQSTARITSDALITTQVSIPS
jgi:hypothetical protein